MSARAGDGAAVDDAKAILNRVRRLVRALRSFDKQAQARHGFGAAQMFILHVLQQEDALSMNDLADRTATDQSSASLAAGKLITQGYVRRETGVEDRRQVRLTLTAKGRGVVRKTPPAAQARIMDSVREMSRAERTKLMALLDKLVAGMEPAPSGDSPMLFEDERPKRREKRPRPGAKK